MIPKGYGGNFWSVDMKLAIKSLIAILSLIICVVISTGCSAYGESNHNDEHTETITSESTSLTNDNDNYEGEEEWPEEYPVSDYQLLDDAFKISGDINEYRYAQLDGAEKVIDTINDYFGISLTLDTDIDYHDGYGNWFYNNDAPISSESASVSGSSVTGKFTFNYKPDDKRIIKASENNNADEKQLRTIAEDFANRFTFVTGKLDLVDEKEAEDISYTIPSDRGNDNVVEVSGRQYYFTSERFSKEQVSLQEGRSCYIECGDSSITDRETQYFVITLWNDGTIIDASNYITSANIEKTGTKHMIGSTDIDKLLTYFTSNTENDTIIIRKVYIDSYSNYFGYSTIQPVIKIEYCFKSDINDIQTTEIVIDGLLED